MKRIHRTACLLAVLAGLALVLTGCRKSEDEQVASKFGTTRALVAELRAKGSLSTRALLQMDQREVQETLRELRPDLPQRRASFQSLQLQSATGAIPPHAIMEALVALERLRDRTRLSSVGRMGVGRILSPRLLMPNLTGPEPQRANWVALGPGNVGGRTRSIVIDPNTPDRMWVGSVGGGIWSSEDGGKSFYPVDDFMANLAICCMAMDPTDPSTIYAGTGEGFYNLDSIRGAGIFRSPRTPNGKWQPLPGTDRPEMQSLTRIAVSADGKIVLAAGQNGKPQEKHAAGIFRSEKVSRSDWTQVSDQEVTDLKFHPTDSLRAVAGGFGQALWSTDGGKTWHPSSPQGPIPGRVELTYARKDPSIVYALVDLNGGEIWKSTDGGRSYNKRDSKLSIAGATILGAQGWYDNVIWAGDPTNSDFLIAGGINLWRSTDGGLSLTDISNWRNRGSVHSDHHAIVAHPGYNGTTNKIVFFGNDGGIYRTSDVSTVGADPERTSGWESLNATYATTQFYGAAGNPSTGIITAGAQDNGTLQLLKDAEKNGWKVINEGDGGWCFAHPTLSDVFFGEYVDLDLFRSRVGGSEPEELSGVVRWREDGKADWRAEPYTIPDAKAAINDNASTANFIPPFVVDSQNPKRIFAGSASLWRTEDADATVDDNTGPSWQAIKDPITSDDPQGGLISAIAVMPGNSDAVWVGHNNGRIFRTSNATAKDPRGTWKEIDAGSPRHLPTGRMCTRIVFDPKHSDVVYVTFGGYEKDNVWKIQIGGTKYTSIHGNVPAVPIFALTIHPKDARILYIGSESGVFSSVSGGTSWSPVNSGPASCSVEDLSWMGETLLAATHGRGMFKIDLTLSPR